MEIQNYNNRDGESRQLYKIRYGVTSLDEDTDVHFLASGIDDALKMFPAFFLTGDRNPSDLSAEVSSEDRVRAITRIRSIERVADVVLAWKE